MSAAGARARNSSSVLLAVAMLAIGLDVGVARITYGVVLPVVARDLQLSLTAAALLGTLHLIGYLLGTLASPSLNAKVGALALCRASHFVFACAMLVCGLTSEVTRRNRTGKAFHCGDRSSGPASASRSSRFGRRPAIG